MLLDVSESARDAAMAEGMVKFERRSSRFASAMGLGAVTLQQKKGGYYLNTKHI